MGIFTDFLDTLGEAIIEKGEKPKRLVGFAGTVPIYSTSPSAIEVLLDIEEEKDEEDSE